jgi:hypothetical protein
LESDNFSVVLPFCFLSSSNPITIVALGWLALKVTILELNL